MIISTTFSGDVIGICHDIAEKKVAAELDKLYHNSWEELFNKLNSLEDLQRTELNPEGNLTLWRKNARKLLNKHERFLLRQHNLYLKLKYTSYYIYIYEHKTLPQSEKFKREFLQRTKISNHAKDVLTEQAEIYYNRLKTIIVPKNERLKVAFYLSCDKYMCSIPRVLPRPKMKYLVKGRKELDIPIITSALDRVDSVANLFGITDIEIRQTAVTILKEYYERLQKGYGSFLQSPTILSCAALIIATKIIKPEYRIQKSDAAHVIGTTEVTLGYYIDTLWILGNYE
jgi:hypothetical protein